MTNNIEKVESMSPQRREELIVAHGMSPYFPDQASVQKFAYATGMLHLIAQINMLQKQVKELKKTSSQTTDQQQKQETVSKKSVVIGEKLLLQASICELLLRQANNNQNAGKIAEGLKNIEKMLRSEASDIDLNDFLAWLNGIDPELSKKEVLDLWAIQATKMQGGVVESPKQTPKQPNEPSRNVEQTVDGSNEGETVRTVAHEIGPSFQGNQQ